MTAEPKELTPKSLAMLVAGLLVLLALSFWRLAPAPGTRDRLEQFSGETMGTTYQVKLVARESHDEGDAPHASIAAPVEMSLDTVNRLMSTYQPDSEVSRFNDSSSTEPFAVSPETAAVVAMALQVSEESGGAFDITVGPLVDAWGFGPDKTRLSPSQEEIDTLRQRVGYQHLSVDLEANTIAKAIPELHIDLSAIAKGYGVDQVAGAVENSGVVYDYFIEVGGEIRTHGLNADGVPWRVGIEKPLDHERTIQRIVGLSGNAMATSGDYRNYYEENGERLSHTIDPRTGRPITHRLASVSVFHNECAMADAYATAIMVLGEDAGMAFAEELGLPVYMLVRMEDGAFEERMSDAFKRDYAGQPD